MKKFVIYILIFSIFQTTILSQFLPLKERYKHFNSSLTNLKFKNKIVKHISFFLSQEVIQIYIKDDLIYLYNNGYLDKKILSIFIKLIYDKEISNFLKNIIIKNLKDKKFKIHFLKIIQNESDPKKIFEKIDRSLYKKISGDILWERVVFKLLKDIFLCSKNRELFFSTLSNQFYNKNSLETFSIFINNYKLSSQQERIIKQTFIGLPYDYSINNWLDKYISKMGVVLKKYLTKKRLNKLFINEKLRDLYRDSLYHLFKNETLFKKFKKYILEQLKIHEVAIENFIYDIIVEDKPLKNIKYDKVSTSCFIIDSFEIDNKLFTLYLETILNNEIFKIDIISKFFRNML